MAEQLTIQDYTAIIQVIVSVIGIYFLIANLRRTNKAISLQTLEFRNSTRPSIDAEISYSHLHSNIQKKECPPLLIKIKNNDIFNLKLEFSYNEFLDMELTFGLYDLNMVQDNLMYFNRLPDGGRIVIRHSIKDNAPKIAEEFESKEAMDEAMAQYDLTIKLSFEDESGYKYFQRIIFNSMYFDKLEIGRVKLIEK
ncbi:hypothetical protein [Sphingobacterium sp.]|uniref:hypothetical protein n=1 Tax=Sphingobacterium sp. TaxID=341027 RepID=UPI0031E268FB